MMKEMTISGTSVAVATTFTNPIDVVKVRLQLAPTPTPTPSLTLTPAAAPAPAGLVATGYNIVRHEGPTGLMKGVGPSVARGVFYGGLRLGLYSPIKAALTPTDAPATFTTKLAAGTLSGTIAAAVSSPSELIKTRLQAKSSAHAPPQGVLEIARNITREGGVAALWQGAVPGMARAGLLTATQCATYDEVKRWVTRTTGLGDQASTHFMCSLITGLITTTATNPADVIKTHMFVGGRQQSSVVACARSIWASGGLPAFFKGWTANYARLGPQTVIIFLVNERLRNLLQMESL